MSDQKMTAAELRRLKDEWLARAREGGPDAALCCAIASLDLDCADALDQLAAAEGEIQRLKDELRLWEAFGAREALEGVLRDRDIAGRMRLEMLQALREVWSDEVFRADHAGLLVMIREKGDAESRLAAVGETLDAMEAEIARLARLKESNGWVPAVTAYGWLKQLRVNLADGVARSWHAFRSLEAGDPMICSICGEHRYARRHHIDAMPRKARAQCDGQEAAQ